MNERWRTGGMIQEEKNRSTGSNACPSTALSTIHPMWPGLGSNSGLYGKTPATKPVDTRHSSRQLSFRKKHVDINVLSVCGLLMILPVTVNILRWVMGWSVNDELERLWMEAAIIRHLPEGTDVSILSSFLPHPVQTRLSRNLLFFWPCIVNWLYINYQLDALIFIYS